MPTSRPAPVQLALRSTRSAPTVKAPGSRFLFVRIAHWIVTICVLALTISGAEIILSHPRFYWGETGNVLTKPLFALPVPSSRSLVPTGYGYVLPDQNGWSRALHFEAAWVLVLTGIAYVLLATIRGHLRFNLLPPASELSWAKVVVVVNHHLGKGEPTKPRSWSYNVIQRVTYLLVIFGLFPMLIWTGLALSPAFDSALPHAVTLLGGRQSARTLHFVLTLGLLLFFVAHIVLVWREGFQSRVGAMITGKTAGKSEDA